MKIILELIFDYIAHIGASRLNCPLFQYFKWIVSMGSNFTQREPNLTNNLVRQVLQDIPCTFVNYDLFPNVFHEHLCTIKIYERPPNFIWTVALIWNGQLRNEKMMLIIRIECKFAREKRVLCTPKMKHRSEILPQTCASNVTQIQNISLRWTLQLFSVQILNTGSKK